MKRRNMGTKYVWSNIVEAAPQLWAYLVPSRSSIYVVYFLKGRPFDANCTPANPATGILQGLTKDHEYQVRPRAKKILKRWPYVRISEFTNANVGPP